VLEFLCCAFRGCFCIGPKHNFLLICLGAGKLPLHILHCTQHRNNSAFETLGVL